MLGNKSTLFNLLLKTKIIIIFIIIIIIPIIARITLYIGLLYSMYICVWAPRSGGQLRGALNGM